MSSYPVLAEAYTLTGADDARLFMRRWSPSPKAHEKAVGRVVLVHGFLEHGGRYHDFASALAAAGIEVVAADLRGHGLSSGRRGHVDDFGHYRADLSQVMAAQTPMPTLVLGHSLGGLIALDLALTGEANLAGIVVTNPFIGPSMPIPLPKRVLGHLMKRLWPTLSLPTGLDRRGLSHDPSVLSQAEHDPLIFDCASAGWWGQVVAAQKRVSMGGTLHMPVLCVLGGADPIASPQLGRSCIARLVAADKTVWERPHDLHEVLFETERWSLWADLTAWMLPRLMGPAQGL